MLPLLVAQLIATVNNGLGGKAKPLDYLPWMADPAGKTKEDRLEAHKRMVASIGVEHGNS